MADYPNDQWCLSQVLLYRQNFPDLTPGDFNQRLHVHERGASSLQLCGVCSFVQSLYYKNHYANCIYFSHNQGSVLCELNERVQSSTPMFPDTDCNVWVPS